MTVFFDNKKVVSVRRLNPISELTIENGTATHNNGGKMEQLPGEYPSNDLGLARAWLCIAGMNA